jgi:hypothetical protein
MHLDDTNVVVPLLTRRRCPSGQIPHNLRAMLSYEGPHCRCLLGPRPCTSFSPSRNHALVGSRFKSEGYRNVLDRSAYVRADSLTVIGR